MELAKNRENNLLKILMRQAVLSQGNNPMEEE